MGKWLTPDTLPLGVRHLCIALPNDDYLIAQFWGAYKLLTFDYKWEQYGLSTPADTARVFFDTFFQTIEETAPMGCVSIGTIVEWSGDISDLPDNYLVADGSDVLIDDYPNLYNLYGNMWGVAAPNHFKLPNLIDRFSVGAGNTYALGDTGGSATVTLTVNEMPQHDHSYNMPVLGAIVIGELSPMPVVDSISPSLTGLSGTGQAHENRPPYFGIWKCIVAR